MYYMDSKHALPYMDCVDHGSSSLFRNIPAEANIPIAVSPDQMMSMRHGSEHKGTHRLSSVLYTLLPLSFVNLVVVDSQTLSKVPLWKDSFQVFGQYADHLDTPPGTFCHGLIIVLYNESDPRNRRHLL